MNSKILNISTGVISLILSGYGFLTGDLITGIVALIITIISIYPLIKKEKTPSTSTNLIKRIKEVIKKAANGDFDDRITNIPQDDNLADIAWNVNDLLDQLEAFERDIKESIKAAENGIDYRDIALQGYKGRFRNTVLMINEAVKAISTAIKEQNRSDLFITLNKLGGGTKKQINDIKTSFNTKLKEFMLKIEK